MELLKIQNLTHYFGGLCAVDDFNLNLHSGELVGIIGPNGAGKTTVFNLISGIYKPTKGSIIFDKFDITGLAPFKISRLGIARTFQNIRLFPQMSVIDNIKTASGTRVEYGLIQSLFHTKSFWAEEHRLDDYCRSLLEIFELDTKASIRASALPYGAQRKLEIARALAGHPRLLLLDEPAAGMNPQETQQLIETIYKIKNEFNLTILIIEHNMRLIMNISERIKVMDFGKTIAEGSPEKVQSDERVIEAYLGRSS